MGTQESFTVTTGGRGFHDITADVRKVASQGGVDTGLAGVVAMGCDVFDDARRKGREQTVALDSLLDAHWIPWQVVIDNDMAELHV